METSFATIDLGSNSFHMIVARQGVNGLRVIDRLREGVRLAGGLTPEGDLLADARQRALDCLTRFGARIKGFDSECVRAVATSTFRQAGRALDFHRQAEEALGYPIEVVSGREEARLIYLGVAHSLAVDPVSLRAVIDIGGGSTEVIIGKGFEPLVMESLTMGCVTSTKKHFPEEEIRPKLLDALEERVKSGIEPLISELERVGWDEVVGASGTIRAIGRVLEVNGFGPEITPVGMQWIRDQLIKHRRFGKLARIKGLKDDRLAIFAGGFAILNGLMQALHMESVRVADGALREGALYDLIGRIHHEDVREKSIGAMQKRFHVPMQNLKALERTLGGFFNDVRETWELKPQHWRWLRWAAALHEVGLDIAHSGFHRHGEYIIRYGDMPGFSRSEQAVVASLIRQQRKSLAALDQEPYQSLSVRDSEKVQRLSVLLRLSIAFHRGPKTPGIKPVLSLLDAQAVHLHLPYGWEKEAPLLAADLEREREQMHPHFVLTWS